MIIIFLGQPGSGKGTQTKLLAEKLNLPKFSIGKLLREEFEKKTKLGITGEKFWGEKGINVPTKISFTILKKYLDNKTAFILDNFPRTLENLKYLNIYLKKRKLSVNYVFHLDIDRDEAERRLIKRAANDEQKYGKRRLDETSELIKIRYDKGYGKEMPEILTYYQKRGLLFNINGMENITDIHNKIINILAKSDKNSN